MLGERPDEVRLEAHGLVGDRAYAVLDTETQKIASAKHPRLWSGLLRFSASFLGRPDIGAGVRVQLADGTALRSDEPHFDDRLSRAIGRSVRLIAAPEPGASYEDEWPDVEGLAPEELIASTQTSTSEDGRPVSTLPVGLLAPGTFQDVAPVTLLTTASLRAAARLQPNSCWDARRFRPNLLVDVEGHGFVENDWVGRHLRIGGVVFDVSAPTPRCVMTTLAQEELPIDREILRTVARHNRIDVGGTGRYACLGVYASVIEPGSIRAGDPVVVL